MSKTHFKCQATIKPEYLKSIKLCLEEQNFGPLVKFIPKEYLFFLDFRHHNHLLSNKLTLDEEYVDGYASDKWKQIPNETCLVGDLLTLSLTMEETEGEISVFVHTILNYISDEILYSENMDSLINIPSEPYPIFRNKKIAENVKLIIAKNVKKVLKLGMLLKQMPYKSVEDIYEDYYI